MTKLEDEFEAMRLMSKLDKDARERVLSWARSRYAPARRKSGRLIKGVLMAMKALGGTARHGEIVTASGLQTGSVSSILSRMEKRGEVIHPATGTWKMTERGHVHCEELLNDKTTQLPVVEAEDNDEGY